MVVDLAVAELGLGHEVGAELGVLALDQKFPVGGGGGGGAGQAGGSVDEEDARHVFPEPVGEPGDLGGLGGSRGGCGCGCGCSWGCFRPARFGGGCLAFGCESAETFNEGYIMGHFSFLGVG